MGKILNHDILSNNKIDVSSDMGFYELLKNYSYIIKGVLSEYINNVIKAYKKMPNKNQISSTLNTTIKIEKTQIVIENDGSSKLKKITGCRKKRKFKK